MTYSTMRGEDSWSMLKAQMLMTQKVFMAGRFRGGEAEPKFDKFNTDELWLSRAECPANKIKMFAILLRILLSELRHLPAREKMDTC